MKQADREDALLRALDLLPENDPSRTDPKFTGNRELAAGAALARETAVDVWLTASPFVAAPAGVLDRIMERIPSGARDLPETRPVLRWWKVAAGAGWAASIAIGCMWFFRPSRPPAAVDAVGVEQVAPVVREQWKASRGAGPSEPSAPPLKDDGGLRGEIARLRRVLETSGQGRPPRIRELSPPGTVAGDPEESRQRLRKLLINALRSSLEAQTGAPGDPAALVIERGWPVEGIIRMEEGTILRHRNFPEGSWEELGLLKGEEGDYYDPATRMIWSPDPEQRGFIGRPAEAGDDLTLFRAEDPARKGRAEPFAQVEPGGFLIENPEDGSVDAVIEGVKPPADGQTQWLVWTLPDGTRREVPVTESMISGTGAIVSNSGYIPFGTNSVQPGGLGSGFSFSVEVRSSQGATIGVILEGGK